MKRLMALVIGIAFVAALGGVAYAQGFNGYGPRMGPGWGAGVGPGAQGMPGRMGMMRGGFGGGFGGGCPGFAATEYGPGAEAVTEEKAKELATAYVDKYFKGYTIERMLPFEGRWATAYRVELKGPKGETRLLHVNPWGRVRPFGPLAAVED
jgi:hypothetical protein